MRFHDMASDRKAQARAAGLPGARGIYPVEAFENSFLFRLGNADAGVSNGDHDPAIGAQGGNLNFPAAGRVLEGIVEQILEDLLETIGVAPRGRQLIGHGNAEGELPGHGL